MSDSNDVVRICMRVLCIGKKREWLVSLMTDGYYFANISMSMVVTKQFDAWKLIPDQKQVSSCELCTIYRPNASKITNKPFRWANLINASVLLGVSML